MVQSKWLAGADDLSDAHWIRRKVFIEEQNVPEHLELDAEDADALHLVVYDGSQPVACGRLLKKEGQFIIGRVAVLSEQRSKRYGDFVMRLLIRRAFELGGTEQHIHAQVAVRPFYEKLGFVAFGDEYEEAGILHIHMIHTGDVFGNC